MLQLSLKMSAVLFGESSLSKKKKEGLPPHQQQMETLIQCEENRYGDSLLKKLRYISASWVMPCKFFGVEH